MSDERILIVEDDPDMRLGYQVLLNAHHYQTFFAGDIIVGVSGILCVRRSSVFCPR